MAVLLLGVLISERYLRKDKLERSHRKDIREALKEGYQRDNLGRISDSKIP